MDDSSVKSLCEGAEYGSSLDEIRDADPDGYDRKALDEENLKRKLRFFFMNPIEKWRTKRKFPFKLLILIFKTVLVTVQLCLFAHQRTGFIDYVFNNRIAFSHLFLEGWDPSREITTYPPQTGDLAIYKIDDFYSALDFAVNNYVRLNETIGSYRYPNASSPDVCLTFCYRHLKVSDRSPELPESPSHTRDVLSDCLPVRIPKPASDDFSMVKFLRHRNVSIRFSSLVDATLSFDLKTVNAKYVPPDCFTFNLNLTLDNSANDGRVKLALSLVTNKVDCVETTARPHKQFFEFLTILNLLIIIVCLLSGILCVRGLYRAQILRRKTVDHFNRYYGRCVTWEGKLEFLNFWYVMIIGSDFLILTGSSLKERIEENEYSGDEWNICGLLLGVGNFFVWFSFLRYLCFFKTYNVIILTLKVAAPALFRFMVCVLLIYAGFTFSGWLILGPYHMKFRSLSGTSECLFALINGDDVFGTFSTLQPTESHLIWWFSRIYLYTFISLFIYVVLSLIVSVIVDAYEVIKNYGLDGFPKSDVREFTESNLGASLTSLASSSLPDCSGVPCLPEAQMLKNLVAKVCCCGKLPKSRRGSVS